MRRTPLVLLLASLPALPAAAQLPQLPPDNGLPTAALARPTGLEWCGVHSDDGQTVPSVYDATERSLSLQRANPDETYEITILFFYTTGFADDFRGGYSMQEEIKTSVDLLNEALENSRVNARFRIVGIERHPAMPTRQERAIAWIVNDERAKRRRDELGADIVYALVDDPSGYSGIACEPRSFTTSTGESCFYGSVNNFTASRRAFDDELVFRTILRHEVGHNLGIQHSPQFGGNSIGGFYRGAVGYSSGPFSHDPEWYGTVMGGNYLPRFSTSSERFDFRGHNNLVVGRPGIHEASTALLHSIGPVSNYRLSVEGPDDEDPGDEDPDDEDPDDEDPDDDGDDEAGPPEASFALGATCAEGLCRVQTGVEVSFEDTSAGTVSERTWDFGDGTVSSEPAPEHAWSSPGFYTVSLTVRGAGTSSTASRTVLVEAAISAGTCEADAETRCFQDSRYAVEMDWRTGDGRSGPAKVVYEGTNDSGLFYFFEPGNNWEVLIKVLNGCGVNEHVWVYGASATTLGYSIRVTDTVTGAVKEYRNDPGKSAPAITDNKAFPGVCSDV